MNSLSGKYDPRIGPLIDSIIFPAKEAQSSSVIPPPDKLNQLNICRGLIDTGATYTCISQDMVNHLKLKRIGTIPISSATEKKDVDVFFVYIGFGLGFIKQETKEGPNLHVKTLLPLSPVRTPKFFIDKEEDKIKRYDLLISRDIICRVNFHMLKNGYYTITL